MDRRNRIIIAISAITILICLLATYAINDGGEEGSRFDSFPKPVTDDMREPMDADEAEYLLSSTIDRFLEVAGTETTRAELEDAIYGLDEVTRQLAVDFLFVDWNHSRDPHADPDGYTKWAVLESMMDSRVNDACRTALSGPNVDEITDILGEEFCRELLADEPVSDEEYALMMRESELLVAYSVCDPYDAYALSEIYLDLVDVRNELADLRGFDSYADYMYSEEFNRDYTPEDVSELALKISGSGMSELVDRMYDKYDKTEVDYTYTDQDQLFDDLEPFIDGICTEFAELYDHMRQYDLIDFEDLDTKMDVGYTSFEDGIVYIFNSPYMDHYDLSALVHEFGHAANFSMISEPTDDLDIREIQSTGLEMLFILDSEYLLGDSTDDYAVSILTDIALVMMDGFVLDEFQQRVYSSEPDSPEDLDAIYKSVIEELNYDPGFDWYLVSHTFQNPFYYISYTMSAFNSLCIFTEALQDYDSAVDTYLDIVAYNSEGYTNMTETLGLPSIFDEGDVSELIEDMLDWIDLQGSDIASV